MAINVVGCVQRQLDSLSMFVRQRLRSTGQRTTMTTATLEDRIAAGESAEQRGLSAGVDAPVPAGFDAAQQRQRPGVTPPPNSSSDHRTNTQLQ